MRTLRRRDENRRRGAAVVVVMIVVGVLGVLSFGMLSMVGSTFRVNRQVKDDAGARFLAEAGLAESLYQLRLGNDGGIASGQQRLEMGGGSFWVESDASQGGGLTVLTATGVQGRSASRVELVVKQANNAFFSWGAFGEDSLVMASNAHVDSYDSSLGDYASQAVNGSGADAYANPNGNIGSNADIILSQNATVEGNAVPGPAGTATLTGNAVVSGSTLPATELQDMPPIDLPTTASIGNVSVSGGSTVTIASGDHAVDDLLIGNNATLVITGPATLLVQNLTLNANADVIIDGTNGPVEIYVVDDFVMNSNTSFGSMTQNPRDLTLNLVSDNILDPNIQVDLDNIDFESNAQLYGTIYAPNAAIEIQSNFELFGSLIAKSVLLDSWSRVHFDEALLDNANDSDNSDFSRVSWRQVPVALSEIHW